MSLHAEHEAQTRGKVDKTALILALSECLPADAILHQTEDLRPYECDGLSAYRQLPLIVLLPRSVDEIQRIMRVCHDQGVPVVARGTGTGLSTSSA